MKQESSVVRVKYGGSSSISGSLVNFVKKTTSTTLLMGTMSTVVGNGVVSAGCFDTVSNYAIAKDSSWLFSLIAWLFKTDGFKKVENSCLELKVAGITDFSKENINAIPAMRSNGISISKENVNAFLRAKKLNNGGVVSKTDVDAVLSVKGAMGYSDVGKVTKEACEATLKLPKLGEEVDKESINTFLEVMKVRACEAKDVIKDDYIVARRLLAFEEEVTSENMNAVLEVMKLKGYDNAGSVKKEECGAARGLLKLCKKVNKGNMSAFLKAAEVLHNNDVNEVSEKEYNAVRDLLKLSVEVDKKSIDAFLKASDFCDMCCMYTRKEDVDAVLKAADVLHGGSVNGVSREEYTIVYELLKGGIGVNKKSIGAFSVVCEFSYLLSLSEENINAILKAAEILHNGDVSKVVGKECKAVCHLLKLSIEVNKKNINALLRAYMFFYYAEVHDVEKKNVDAILKVAETLHKGKVDDVTKEECKAACRLLDEGMEVNEENMGAVLKIWGFYSYANGVDKHISKKNVDAAFEAARILHSSNINDVTKEEYEAVLKASEILKKEVNSVTAEDCKVILKTAEILRDCRVCDVTKKECSSVLKAAKILHDGDVDSVTKEECKVVLKASKVLTKEVNAVTAEDCEVILKMAEILHASNVDKVRKKDYASVLKAAEMSNISVSEVTKEDYDNALAVNNEMNIQSGVLLLSN